MGDVKEDAGKLIKLMIDGKEEKVQESGGRVCVNLEIVGMAGIGKTTLASSKIFDIVSQSGNFRQRMWICVSNDSKEEDLLKKNVRLAGGNH